MQTDSNSSRELCLREVYESKSRRVAISVIDYLPDMDSQSFPYLGDVPVVRQNSSHPDQIKRIQMILNSFLCEIFLNWLWDLLVGGLRWQSFVTTLSARVANSTILVSGERAQNSKIAHLELTLNTGEYKLFSAIDPKVRILTITNSIGEY